MGDDKHDMGVYVKDLHSNALPHYMQVNWYIMFLSLSLSGSKNCTGIQISLGFSEADQKEPDFRSICW